MIEKKIREERKNIDNYKRLLKTLIVLYKFTKEKYNGEFYFGGNITPKNGKPNVTPDIIIKLDNNAIIGEAKKSLPEPENFESKEEFIKKVIEEKIINQLKKYDNEFSEIEAEEHDIILLVPESASNAIAILKFDYFDKGNPLKRKLALLVYTIEDMANTEEIRVRLDWGSLSTSQIQDDLRRTIKYYEGQISKELGKFKIFEEHKGSTPIIYVMYILWSQIFPDIIEKSKKERIIEWYKEQKNEFEVKHSKLVEYLGKMYSLPYLSPGDSPNSRIQFRSKLISDAMENFVKIELAQIVSSSSDPLYRVTWKKLPEKDVIGYFAKKLHSNDKEKVEESELKQGLPKWLK